MTTTNAQTIFLPTFAPLGTGPVIAAPLEGEIASNAAAVLVVLGVLALFMGARNLRELRHKRLSPYREKSDTDKHEV